MAECGICKKDSPVRQDFKIYTYILRMSSIGGRSTLQVKNDRVFFHEHTYAICNSCYKKYGNTFPLIFWVPAILLAIYSVIDAFLISKLGFTPLCVGGIVALILAYKLTDSSIFDIEKKLIKKAISERKETNWRSEIAKLPGLHYRAQNPRTGAEIRGLTEGEYKKLMEQKQ